MEKEQFPAVLIGLRSGKTDDLDEHLDELAFLAETLGITVRKRFVQSLSVPDSRTLIGKGKLEEVVEFVRTEAINTVIFDNDLSPSQLRNLERALNPKDAEEPTVKIYDRTLLILDIFLQRARTAQARTQVELARYQYLLPRLTRLWSHLERQRGGTGTRGGAGEKEIETDRRNIRNQIAVLKERLEKIEKQRETQRKGRQNVVRVAIVGYTNAGKSSLMNLLSGSGVLAEDKLFATVDATVRKVVFGNLPFLLSDTVGFIRKLPHHLVESFKSTLDEVREADVILHVVDASHPAHDNHIDVVNTMLTELGVTDVPTILVLNKVDKLSDPPVNPEAMKGYYRQKGFDHIVFVSVLKGDNIDLLKRTLYDQVLKKHLTFYPNYLKDGYHFSPWQVGVEQ